jgi:DNA polymerase I-like protein with 3'-5' exonuclease and polymerase domains
MWTLPTELPSLAAAKQISIDLETSDPNLKKLGPGTFRKDGYIVGVALNTGDGFSEYYPVGHKQGPNLPKEVLFPWLKEELSREHQPKIGARLLYDMEWLWFEGVKIKGPKYDVQIAEALLDENKFKYNLDSIAINRLGKHKKDEEMLNAARKYGFKPGEAKQHMEIYSPEEVAPYAITDTDLPLDIFNLQKVELNEQNLWPLFSMETELLDCLLAMRINGVPVDIRRAEELQARFKDDERTFQKDLDKFAGTSVQVWAADSISKAFDLASIPYPRTPKTNAPSFTQEWLAAHQSDLARRILELRKINRTRNSFIEKMILGHSINGRIHPQFHPVKHDEGGTVGGRFSSSDPNLQQVPSRHPIYGPLVRSLFIPEHGCKWNKNDYSQQEPRLTVHYAYLRGYQGAKEARDRYVNDPSTDYHTYVAELCNCERRLAKDINLGLAYGMGIAKMAEKLGLSEPETAKLYKTYHDNVRYMKPLATDTMNIASTRGYVKTILGRRRRFNMWVPPGRYTEKIVPLEYDAALKQWGLPLKRAFTHKALNSVIQGSAADMIKKAMCDAFRAGYIPHLTVHDELNQSVNEERQATDLKEIMIEAIKLEVPLKVDSFIANNWGECK